MKYINRKHLFIKILSFVVIILGINTQICTVNAKKSGNKQTTMVIHNRSSKKDATHQIQAAIDKLASNGGGKLTIDTGTYHLKYLNLKSNLELHLDHGTKLVFSDKFSDYPAVNTRYEGSQIKMHHPDIYGNKVHNVSITGSGTLDGNGKAWWKMYNDAKNGPLKQATSTPLKYTRPFLIAFDYSSNIKITGIKLINSPAWTIHPLESDNVLIQGITIDNPLDSPNTDGIDPESSSDVKILNNTISDGDDCIAIKSGIETTIPKSSCHNIIIANNLMQHGHGGVVLGSEMSGDIENVVINSNVFDHTDRGIRMKTRRGRGGTINNISVSNIIMQDVLTPLAINEYYGKSGAVSENYLSTQKQPINAGTPTIKNVSLSDITATGVSSVAGFVYGLPESPVANLTLTNYSVTMAPNAIPQKPEMITNGKKFADAGFWMENTNNVHFNGVNVYGANTGIFVHNFNNTGLVHNN
ncbi:glycoside hydrolase family 28 protein [Lactobacillus sp. ESL0684]|uniref:glycoside hydrolase family 28 protein n=1 Tax=Lactobacillus sp. ESL0684 TaxID=2983213 RepID=UPI0023F8AE5D|nr:glycoside hydrolase family 28 protein [Lactobacillus sp. ESL0684]WEV43592.1 glycoside hydrolase family 28 protein [Lactobacillus sp. ESL0684]